MMSGVWPGDGGGGHWEGVQGASGVSAGHRRSTHLVSGQRESTLVLDFTS